jgi:hypothetical protein
MEVAAAMEAACLLSHPQDLQPMPSPPLHHLKELSWTFSIRCDPYGVIQCFAIHGKLKNETNYNVSCIVD